MAQSSNIVKGQELMLFQDGKSIAFATSHTLSITGNTTDISSKDHGFFTASALTSITWEISAENLYTDAAFDKYFNAMVNTRNTVEVVFGHYTDDKSWATSGIVSDGDTTGQESWTAPTGDSPSVVYYKGNAYITSLSANAANGDNATFSVTLSGVGKLEQVGYNPETQEPAE